MKPKVYDKTGTILLGELENCIQCFTEEERNGSFTVTLTYPITDGLHEHLIYDNIILCKPNDEQENQLFRIYNTERIIRGTVTVKALHISFDLTYDYIRNLTIENESCEFVLNSLFRNSQFSSHYVGYSDILTLQDYQIQDANILEAICGKAGSVIDTFGLGAEIKRDNTNIYVYGQRGEEKDITIEYSVNMLDEALQVDTTDLTTAIFGYATYMTEIGETEEVRTGRIDSPLIENYAHPFIVFKDYTEHFIFDGPPTVEKLETLVEQEFSLNKVDIPKCSYTLNFVPLSKCSGYENIQDAIHLCDTIKIKDSRYGIDTAAKIIKYNYNVLTERYDSMELGDPRDSLVDVINNQGAKGDKGDKGEQGAKGEDGNIQDFPDSLPEVPVVTLTTGLGVIQIDWTYQNLIYYTYELYASTTKNFTPTIFNLLYSGQGSSYAHTVPANTTWYYKVRCVNTWGNATDFSMEVYGMAGTIDAESDWIAEGAITDALVGTLNLGREWYGLLSGHYIDGRGLVVTDAQNAQTFRIDINGNVSLNASNLKIDGSDVATRLYTDSAVGAVETNVMSSATAAINTALTDYYSKDDTDEKFSEVNMAIGFKADKTEVTNAINGIKVGGTNLIGNGGPINTDGWMYNEQWIISLNECNTAPFNNAIRFTNTNGYQGAFYKLIDKYKQLTVGESYTISAWIRASKTCKMSFKHENMQGSNEIEVTTQWKHFTFTAPIEASTSYTGKILELIDSAVSYMWVEIHSLKLEKGTIPTEWSMSELEVKEYVDNSVATVNGTLTESLTATNDNVSNLQNTIQNLQQVILDMQKEINKLKGE